MFLSITFLPGNAVHAVRVTRLTRSYLEGSQHHHVLRDLHLEVASGETVALRGRSGSGKSTLLNLISGIDVPDSGEVLVAGCSITGMTERERTLYRRKHIGFVYQAFNLVPTLSVADNIRLVLELNGVSASTARERIVALLEDVGLADRQASYPDVLSGGEQQRVAIARAIAHRPRLILADEPTGNLDAESAETVLALLESMTQQAGATMIVATHSDAIARRCSRVVELRNGQLRD